MCCQGVIGRGGRLDCSVVSTEGKLGCWRRLNSQFLGEMVGMDAFQGGCTCLVEIPLGTLLECTAGIKLLEDVHQRWSQALRLVS